MQQQPKWAGACFLINAMPHDLAKVNAAVAAAGLARTQAFSAVDNFFQLPAMLAQCDLIISVETSIMHLANAVHVPVVALMRKKNPEWAPFDSASSTVLTVAKRNDWVDAITRRAGTAGHRSKTRGASRLPSMLMRTRSATLSTPSLSIRRALCTSTVRTEMPSTGAISRLWRPVTTSCITSRSRGVRLRSKSSPSCWRRNWPRVAASRENASSMAASSLSWSNGFSRKSLACALKAWRARVTSPWPVTIITGSRQPSSSRRRCSDSPSMPDMRISISTQPAHSRCQPCKKSSAQENSAVR